MSIVATRRPSLGSTMWGLGEGASSTPGRLRLLSVSIATGVIVLWLAGTVAVANSQRSVDGIGRHAVPAIIDAQQIHAALADADRSAANGFLSGSPGSAAARQRYQRDIGAAATQLERAAEHNEAGDAASRQLQTIIAMVGEYQGLVETARADNLQGFPVGAAYLRGASALMHRPGDGILARLDTLGELNSQDLRDQGTSLWIATGALAVFAPFGVAVLGLLVGLQRFLRRAFRRRRNERLMVATVLLVLMSAGLAAQAASTNQNLVVAQRQAFPRLHLLWQARSLAEDANGNESLSLIARGNGAAFDDAFKAETRQLVDRPLSDELVRAAADGDVRFTGLLADELKGAGFAGERDAAMAVLRAYQRFTSVDAAVRARAGGDYAGAVALALGSAPGQLAGAFADLDAAFAGAIAIVQRQFDGSISRAGPGLLPALGLAVVSLAIVLLVVWGISPRLAEYRA